MKEWCLKHPLLTFILFDLTAYNVLTIVNNIVKLRGKKYEQTGTEEENHEPAGDIQ